MEHFVLCGGNTIRPASSQEPSSCGWRVDWEESGSGVQEEAVVWSEQALVWAWIRAEAFGMERKGRDQSCLRRNQ